MEKNCKNVDANLIACQESRYFTRWDGAKNGFFKIRCARRVLRSYNGKEDESSFSFNWITMNYDQASPLSQNGNGSRSMAFAPKTMRNSFSCCMLYQRFPLVFIYFGNSTAGTGWEVEQLAVYYVSVDNHWEVSGGTRPFHLSVLCPWSKQINRRGKRWFCIYW